MVEPFEQVIAEEKDESADEEGRGRYHFIPESVENAHFDALERKLGNIHSTVQSYSGHYFCLLSNIYIFRLVGAHGH